jgi:hypothetical protein
LWVKERFFDARNNYVQINTRMHTIRIPDVFYKREGASNSGRDVSGPNGAALVVGRCEKSDEFSRNGGGGTEQMRFWGIQRKTCPNR